MALKKNRSKKDNNPTRAGRVVLDNARRGYRLHDPYRVPTRSRRELQALADRRTFHPWRPEVEGVRRPPQLVAVTLPESRKSTPYKIRVKDPRHALVCIRRQQRKEVIHARGKAGGKTRKPRYNSQSEISCRK